MAVEVVLQLRVGDEAELLDEAHVQLALFVQFLIGGQNVIDSGVPQLEVVGLYGGQAGGQQILLIVQDELLQLFLGVLGQDVIDQVPGALVEHAGGDAVFIHHDVTVLQRRNIIKNAGGLQRGGVGHGHAAAGTGKDGGVVRAELVQILPGGQHRHVELIFVPTAALDPFALFDAAVGDVPAGALGHFLQRVDTEEVDLLLIRGIAEEVLVAVVEAGQHGLTVQVHHLTLASGDIAVHIQNAAVLHQQGMNDLCAVHGVDAAIAEQSFHDLLSFLITG